MLATGEGCIATRSIRLRRGQQNIVAAPFVCLAMAATLADVIGYRFLVDRDVSKVAEHLPRKRTLTLSDAGLPFAFAPLELHAPYFCSLSRRR